MIQLAVLPLALTLGAGTPAVDASAVETASIQNVQDTGGQAAAEEPDFFAKYYPLSFDENLEPEVEENFMLLYLLGTGILFGNIWGPMVLIGSPGDMVMDQVISFLVHAAPNLIPGVNCILGPATLFYLLPVATINITDRSLKAAKKAGTWQGKGARNAVRPPNEQELALAEPIMAF